MIQLIATDMDGTLLEPGGVLPEGFFETALRLQALGVRFAAASGRQHDNLRRLFQPIARDMGFVCENGNLNAVGNEIISTHPMERAMALEIINTLQNNGLKVLLSGVRCCYLTADNKAFSDLMFYHQRNTLAVVDRFDTVDDDFVKVSAFCEKGISPYIPKLLDKWSGRVNAACSGGQWFDFGLANKGVGLRDLMRRLGIQREAVVAFGDNFNDESMFKQAGHPFLMKTADSRLLKPGIRSCEKVLPVLKAIADNGGELPIVTE